jgi:propionyl-CoA carboxylase alpha chain/3-methylcrotonyl-CoA carboxylase alpha subunit
VNTGFIEARLESLVPPPETPPHVAAAAAITDADNRRPDRSPWTGAPGGLFGFRLNAPPNTEARLAREGEAFSVLLTAPSADEWTADVDAWSFPVSRAPRGWEIGDVKVTSAVVGDQILVFDAGAVYAFSEVTAAEGAEAAGDGVVLSPMPGKVIQVSVAAGETVRKGQALLTLEAMKMEHVLTAAFDGTVAALAAGVGDQVAEGVLLIRLEKAA